jgi:cytosine/uracil/thiamine/allantoin permease
MSEAWSALRALNVIIGLFSSLAVNMPDFGRFSKYENAGYSQFIFLPLLGTLGALSPIFVTSAVQYLWGEYIWFMPAVIAKFDNRAAMVGFQWHNFKLIVVLYWFRNGDCNDGKSNCSWFIPIRK